MVGGRGSGNGAGRVGYLQGRIYGNGGRGGVGKGGG